MEDYFERVVETLTSAGYRWYETANFCRTGDGRDLRARHNLGYWLGHDYLGIGIGAVSTVGGLRWRNAPSLPRYLAALRRHERPQRELEQLEPGTTARERVMLGLRLDEPLELAGLDAAVDPRCAGAAPAARPDRGQRQDARAHPPWPVPRRRRHGRAAGRKLEFSCKWPRSASANETSSGAWSRSTSRPASRSARRRWWSAPGCPSRRAPCATSLPSSRRSACSRTHTRPPAGSRPRPATASTRRACSSARSRGRRDSRST